MPYRPEAYDNIRQQMDENEYNLTQQLQQSNQQQMLAIQAAQNWASQNAAQNMQAAQQTFHLGFNNMANDLGWLRSAVPPFGQGGFQNQQMPSSLMNMSLGQSVMGAVGGFGVPNNVRVNDWQRMSVHDLGNRAGNLAASAPISAVELGADLASFGFLFNRASAAATAAGITGWGAAGVGMAAGAFGAGILAGPVYNATEYIREQVSTQARLENMLFSSSYGKMPQTQRAGLASGMRHAIRQDDTFSMGEGLSLAAYGTEAGMLNVNQESSDYLRNFDKLKTSAKSVMQTFHQTIKEAVDTMREMRQAGISDPADIAKAVSTMAVSGRISGLSPGAMGSILVAGAQQSVGTAVATQTGGEMAVSGTGLAGIMVKAGIISEAQLANITGKTGSEAQAAAGIGLTSGITSFMSGGSGASFLKSITTATGELDRASLDKLLSGGYTSEKGREEFFDRRAKTDVAYAGRMAELGEVLDKNAKKLTWQEEAMASIRLAEQVATAHGLKDGEKMTRGMAFGAFKSLGINDRSAQEVLFGMYNNPEAMRSLEYQTSSDRADQLSSDFKRTTSLGSMWDRALKGEMTSADRANLEEKSQIANVRNIVDDRGGYFSASAVRATATDAVGAGLGAVNWLRGKYNQAADYITGVREAVYREADNWNGDRQARLYETVIKDRVARKDLYRPSDQLFDRFGYEISGTTIADKENYAQLLMGNITTIESTIKGISKEDWNNPLKRAEAMGKLFSGLSDPNSNAAKIYRETLEVIPGQTQEDVLSRLIPAKNAETMQALINQVTGAYGSGQSLSMKGKNVGSLAMGAMKSFLAKAKSEGGAGAQDIEALESVFANAENSNILDPEFKKNITDVHQSLEVVTGKTKAPAVGDGKSPEDRSKWMSRDQVATGQQQATGEMVSILREFKLSGWGQRPTK